MSNNFRILSLPGLHGSEASHWQTIWEQHYGFERVNQETGMSRNLMPGFQTLDSIGTQATKYF